jgi:hypothetical protein
MLNDEGSPPSRLYSYPNRPEPASLPDQTTLTVVDPEKYPSEGEVMVSIGADVSTVNLMVSTKLLPAWSQACTSTVWVSSLRPENSWERSPESTDQSLPSRLYW